MVPSVVLVQLATLASVLGFPVIDTVLGDMNAAVLVRDKRDPSRSLTFSGFLPGSGMSAFASSADYSPYPRSRRPWGPQVQGGEYPEEPSPVEQPPERGQAPWPQPEEKEKDDKEEGEEELEEEEAPITRPPRKNKKKYSPKETTEDEEEDDKPSRGGGNAAASFNAWFPIMLGMFPSNGGYPWQGEEGGYSRGGQGQGRYPPASHTTVIANSVSHGRSGVASSHAVAYGGGGSGTPHSSPHNSPPHRR
ncbi:uncharacterized protein LOC124363293 [Homalodisca vitripennis]|uniref:uncharacterized protein LOC124363293 n=1 Tax=Homalodisca vitripennis TaxID=197043 RepID=UPI001EEB46EC|nr:uncharacterized protein LOC124363293 [Homalodisca vitripennis]